MPGQKKQNTIPANNLKFLEWFFSLNLYNTLCKVTHAQ